MVVILSMTTTVASAQQNEMSKLRWKGLSTNRFWDNWEISAGFGNSYLSVSKHDPGKFVDRNSWNANIGFTKWVHPLLGMRLQLDAGQFQNYSMNKARYGNDLFQSPYIFVHGDIMLNLSNWIGGYREDRVYYAIPYIGFGYTALNFTGPTGSYNGEFSATGGMLNKFRVCRQLDIELDLRTWVLREHALAPEIQAGGSYAFACSASIGLSYRFNKRYWTPAFSEVEVAGYLAAIADLGERLVVADEELIAAGNKLGELSDENSRLRSDLEECKRQKQPVIVEDMSSEVVVFFHIGESQLTDYAKATLNGYIEAAKGGDKAIVVTGYADKETGSAAINEQLSHKRAVSVQNYMIEHGIAAKRITAKWVGDTETAFTSPDTPIVNRCVIIE